MKLFNLGMPVSDIPIFFQLLFLAGVVGWLVILMLPSERRSIFRRR